MTRAAPIRDRRLRAPGATDSPAPPSPPSPGEVLRAIDLLRDAGSVTVLAHIHPDADALGSALALGLALEGRGAAVQVSFAEPDAVPRSLAALPGQHLLVPAAEVEVGVLLVTVDVNTRSRLGDLARLVDLAPRTLVVDHHASNGGFGTDQLIDASAESTTVLVAALLDGLGVEVDAAMAANLYAGLATDSVGFRHASARAHRLAALWLDTGIDPDALLRPISDTHPIGWLGLLSRALGRAALEQIPGSPRRLIWTVIPHEEAGVMAQEELDSVIDILRTVQEADVAAVLKERDPGVLQVSLRSRPGVDVSRVATALGGGGHLRAAGFVHDGSTHQAVAALLEALRG